MTASRAISLAPTSALRLHPAFEAIPGMRPAEMMAFTADVAERGVLEPLRVAPDGLTVFDGRHRLRAAQELGLEVVLVTPAECGPGNEAGYALRAALHRRHLSDDQRAVLAVRLAAERGAGHRSGRARTAAQARWSEIPSAPADLAPDACVPPRGDASSPRSASDHPSRAEATRALGVSKQRFEAARQLMAAAPDLAAQVEAGSVLLVAARNTAKRRAALAELAGRPEADLPEDAELWQGDFRELGQRIPDGSVDLVFTDPPFDTAGLALWPEFARVAHRVLKPGGFALVYAGILRLPEGLAALADAGLVYWWTAAIGVRAPAPMIHLRAVRTSWRPVLILVKPPVPTGASGGPMFQDFILNGPPREKAFHDWQQRLGPARQLLRRFSRPGQLVLDFFAGSGTFPLAALVEGRRALGIEFDPEPAAIARARMAQALAERDGQAAASA